MTTLEEVFLKSNEMHRQQEEEKIEVMSQLTSLTGEEDYVSDNDSSR